MFRQPKPGGRTDANESDWEWGIERAADAPVELSDIPRIIDLYGYLQRGPAGAGRVIPGGAGAYCYYGPSALSFLGRTPIEGWVDDLFGYVTENFPEDVEDFRLTYDGFSFRALREWNEYGAHLSLRSLPTSVPRLNQLSLDYLGLRTLLLGDWLSDGLTIFCGLTGQGKTTLAGATLATRLEARGGRAVTVEDVLEMPLEGVWGIGSCRQLQVDRTDPNPLRNGFAGAARRAYRALPATRPAILYFGEVRDTETAEEAVKAAANGMSVITTIHAGDTLSAIMRLVNLAKPAMGTDGALESVAQGLRLVVHSQLDLSPTVVGWRRGKFKTSILASDNYTSPAANAIRTNKLAALSQPIDHQMRAMEKVRLTTLPELELLRALFGGASG